MSGPSDSKVFTSAAGESKEQLLQLIENVKDYAIFMLDPRGHVKTWNQGAERLKETTTNAHFNFRRPRLQLLKPHLWMGNIGLFQRLHLFI
jgi:hypothetical protein